MLEREVDEEGSPVEEDAEATLSANGGELDIRRERDRIDGSVLGCAKHRSSFSPLGHWMRVILVKCRRRPLEAKEVKFRGAEN